MTAPLDFFNYQDGTLSAQGISMSRIADMTGTPVYVYSSEAFLKPLKELQKGLQGLDHLVCFAVKANSNIALLKMLGQAGAGMDLVSGGELFRARTAGVASDRIVFSGVGKTPGEMRQALESDILSFNVESTAELEILSEVATRLGKRASVALRFNPDVDAKTHPYISTGLKKNKFGLQRPEILAVAKSIDEYPGIDFNGISIHIGSQLLSLKPLKDAFAKVRDLLKSLDAILPQPISRIDLGGGVGITYKNEKAPKLSDYTKLIHQFFGARSGLGRPIKILIEPGRTLSGNSGVLLTEVLYRKQRGKKDFIVVDSAMNDLIRPALYQSYHEIVAVDQKTARSSKKLADVVGPVCESSDCFASDRKLPANLAGGELLAILSAGAYGFTMASNYNTRPRPPEVLIHDGKITVIRTRETYDDLIRGEKLI